MERPSPNSKVVDEARLVREPGDRGPLPRPSRIVDDTLFTKPPCLLETLSLRRDEEVETSSVFIVQGCAIGESAPKELDQRLDNTTVRYEYPLISLTRIAA